MHPNIIKIANKWSPYIVMGTDTDYKRFSFPLVNRVTNDVDRVFTMFTGDIYTDISGSVAMGYNLPVWPPGDFSDITSSRSLKLDSTQFDRYISAYLSSKTHIYYKPHLTQDDIDRVIEPVKNKLQHTTSAITGFNRYVHSSAGSHMSFVARKLLDVYGHSTPYILCTYTYRTERETGFLVTAEQLKKYIIKHIPSYYLPPDDGKIIDLL